MEVAALYCFRRYVISTRCFSVSNPWFFLFVLYSSISDLPGPNSLLSLTVFISSSTGFSPRSWDVFTSYIFFLFLILTFPHCDIIHNAPAFLAALLDPPELFLVSCMWHWCCYLTVDFIVLCLVVLYIARMVLCVFPCRYDSEIISSLFFFTFSSF